jgi:hypothetical protein
MSQLEHEKRAYRAVNGLTRPFESWQSVPYSSAIRILWRGGCGNARCRPARPRRNISFSLFASDDAMNELAGQLPRRLAAPVVPPLRLVVRGLERVLVAFQYRLAKCLVPWRLACHSRNPSGTPQLCHNACNLPRVASVGSAYVLRRSWGHNSRRHRRLGRSSRANRSRDLRNNSWPTADQSLRSTRRNRNRRDFRRLPFRGSSWVEPPLLIEVLASSTVSAAAAIPDRVTPSNRR